MAGSKQKPSWAVERLGLGEGVLPWAKGLGRGEAGIEEMVYNLAKAWGALSRAPHPLNTA